MAQVLKAVRSRKVLLALPLALLLSGCGVAQYYLCRIFGPDHYYVAASLPTSSLRAPPAPGSPEDRKDFEVLRGWQARRTEADCAAARAQAQADYDRFFGDVSPFPQPLPEEVSSILFRVYYDGGRAVSAAKKRYARQRPFRRDKTLSPCLGRVSGFSYPSGHAALSRLFALVLSDVDPARRAEFFARAERAALNRVIGGVHHPSDIEAGKLLGSAVYEDLVKEPAFRSDLEKLKALVKKDTAVR